jgi:hypothetical protein
MRHLRENLVNFIEPDFGLLDKLYTRRLITKRQFNEIYLHKTAEKRNKQLLDIFTDHNADLDISGFLESLRDTDQKHVACYIEKVGGQYVVDNRFLIAVVKSKSGRDGTCWEITVQCQGNSASSLISFQIYMLSSVLGTAGRSLMMKMLIIVIHVDFGLDRKLNLTSYTLGRMHQQSISEKGPFSSELLVHFPTFQ